MGMAMGAGSAWRFVKTPGSQPLPDGVSRRYAVFAREASLAGAPELVFDLDKPHMRGITWIRTPASDALVLSCQEKSGGGRWQLQSEQGERLADIAGQGVLSPNWALKLDGEDPVFELSDPRSFARQTVETMLEGDTDNLVLSCEEQAVGELSKQHRSVGGGLVSGIRRFVQGRDWVLELQQAALSRVQEAPETRIAVQALALAAIVALEFGSPD